MHQETFCFVNSSIHTAHTISDDPSLSVALHCHSFYEIYYFIQGNVSYLVEGREYTPEPHSMLLFSPNVFHGVKVQSKDQYERYTLHFNSNILTPESKSLLLSPFDISQGSQNIYYQRVDRFHIKEYFEDFFRSASVDEDIRSLSMRIRMENLLNQILMMSRAVQTTHPHPAPSNAVDEIINYLNLHLTEPVTLDSLAERFFISKYHLETLFKKATGTTVIDYMIRKRAAAARQLMAQGETAGSAAIQAGFRDYSVFFRACKKIYGCPPSEFLHHSPMEEASS